MQAGDVWFRTVCITRKLDILALVDVTAHEHLAAAATYICQLHTYMSWSPVMSHNDMP